MLSKFQTDNKREAKKFSRRAIANLLLQEVERKKEVSQCIRNVKAENSLNDRGRKIKWQINPLYKAKTSNTEESESESITSLLSWQSYLPSQQSIDSGYKSSTEERNKFHVQENIPEKVNFHKTAMEMLDTMKALGARVEENTSTRKALEECEHELEKLCIGNYDKIC